MDVILIINEDMENRLIRKSLEQNKLCFKALGSSMFPFVRNGDMVTIKKVKSDTLLVGEIVFYEKDGSFCLHRFLKRNSKNEIITKGDNQPILDTPISSEDVLGKLIIIKRDNQVITLDSRLNKIMGRLIAVFYPLTYPVTRLLIKSYQLI